MRLIALSSLVVLSLLACNKPATDTPLPPAGLAGAAGTGNPHGAPSTALPGAGAQVDPGGAGGAALPSGHPPIGAGAGGAAGGAGGMPMDHSNRPDPGGALPLPGGGSMGATSSGVVTIAGTVAEALNVPEYTYMRVKVAAGADEWVAVPRTTVAVGDKVTVNQSIVMNNFPSKALNRTFDKLTMGVMVGAPQKAN